jgi:threonine/homoserine/homoserine lactone efflux protein
MNTTNGSPSGTNRMNTETKDGQMKLSILWTFALLNYLYCDVVGLMDPKLLKQFIAGNAGGIAINEGFLLGASILMEIPIAMILLSQILKYRANRWANIIAGAIMTVVQIASLTFGTVPTSYYIFFSVIEIASTAFIVWYAWKWANPEAQSLRQKELSLP